jgi:hypothetical protein
MTDNKFTVGDLRRLLNDWPEDHELIFQGGLTFYRLDIRGPNLVQLEFNQPVHVPEDQR